MTCRGQSGRRPRPRLAPTVETSKPHTPWADLRSPIVSATSITRVTTGTRDTAVGTAPTDAAMPAVPQYSLSRILGTWALAALPMGALAWLVAPLLAHRLDGPTALPRALIVTLTAGLVWQFLLVLILVYREQRSLRWRVLKDALWLRAPRSPRTGRRGGRAWLVLLP